MLKLAGIILLMMGCVGLGVSKVSEEKRRINELRAIRRVIFRIQSEMAYGKRTLPEICLILSKCTEDTYKQAFLEIYNKFKENDGSILEDIWKAKLEKCMKELPLKEDEKAVLIRLPEHLGILDETIQAKNIGQSLDMIEERIKNAEHEYEGKSRVIMSISVMTGLFLIILLL